MEIIIRKKRTYYLLVLMEWISLVCLGIYIKDAESILFALEFITCIFLKSKLKEQYKLKLSQATAEALALNSKKENIVSIITKNISITKQIR